MSESEEQYGRVCRPIFTEIRDTLRRIDCALRGGNGKVGIEIRLDRLETFVQTVRSAGRDWRRMLLGVLGQVLGAGAIAAAIVIVGHLATKGR